MQKTYLLIGASSGIGLATAKKLAEHRLHLISRQPKQIFNSQTYSVDICNFETPLPIIDESIDGLVYFPGTINLKPFKQLTLQEFRHEWEVNTLGVVRVIQHYLSSLTKASHPAIVLISTVAVNQGMAFHTSTGSAKGALEAFGRALAAELAPHIRVNMIAPSLTDTPLSTGLLNTETKREHAAKRHPLQSTGTIYDQADAICYLLSEEARWITGQVLHVDGGLSSITLI